MSERADIADELRTKAVREVPALLRIAEAAAPDLAFLVGGGVRDLLQGRGLSDVDVVIEGDAGRVADALGAEVTHHARFATAKLKIEGTAIDLASSRREVYRHPGALPEVSAASIEDDLKRRDFTINAMALSITKPAQLLDPFGGADDLERGLIRVLHDDSFVDDPTRAIRAARYSSRFSFAVEAHTDKLIRETDLSTISTDRRDEELRRLALEPRTGPKGLGLLGMWELVELQRDPAGVVQGMMAQNLLANGNWGEEADAAEVILRAVLAPPGPEVELAKASPRRNSEAVEIASGHSIETLLLAALRDPLWLKPYLDHWRHITPDVNGADLIEAGIPEGPALGAGLEAALEAKLDQEADRETQLGIALASARREIDAVE